MIIIKLNQNKNQIPTHLIDFFVLLTAGKPPISFCDGF
mgnify:CR=1 FL=1